MRVLHALSLSLLAVGLTLLSWGILREGGQLYFVAVFPVLVLQGPLTTLGAFLLFIGVFLGFFSIARLLPARLLGAPSPGPSFEGSSSRSPESPYGPVERTKERRFGGVLLLGPVPIVFGSDERITKGMLLAGAVITMFLLLLIFLTSLGG